MPLAALRAPSATAPPDSPRTQHPSTHLLWTECQQHPASVAAYRCVTQAPRALRAASSAPRPRRHDEPPECAALHGVIVSDVLDGHVARRVCCAFCVWIEGNCRRGNAINIDFDVDFAFGHLDSYQLIKREVVCRIGQCIA